MNRRRGSHVLRRKPSVRCRMTISFRAARHRPTMPRSGGRVRSDRLAEDLTPEDRRARRGRLHRQGPASPGSSPATTACGWWRARRAAEVDVARAAPGRCRAPPRRVRLPSASVDVLGLLPRALSAPSRRAGPRRGLAARRPTATTASARPTGDHARRASSSSAGGGQRLPRRSSAGDRGGRSRHPGPRPGERARRLAHAAGARRAAAEVGGGGRASQVTVLDEKAIRAEGSAACSASTAGSAQPPRFVELALRRRRGAARLASPSSARASRSTPAACRIKTDRRHGRHEERHGRRRGGASRRCRPSPALGADACRSSATCR